MRLNPQAMINSRIGVALALGLGRITPPKIGYLLARFAADRISGRRNWGLVQAVRVNQWVVSQKKLSGPELDQAVQVTFRNQARFLFDLYHHLDDAANMDARIIFSPQCEQIIRRSQHQKEGTVVVGVHTGNFDFVMQTAARCGLRALTLAAPETGGGYHWQNEIRRRQGLEIIPASMASLREATDRLNAGRTVLTGIDRPQPGSKYRPMFFGCPAAVPVLHIYLALKAKVPVIVVAAIQHPDRVYEIMASDPIEMQPHPDRHTEIIQNAETVLNVAAEFIRMAPQQWSMFYPVWPDVQAELP